MGASGLSCLSHTHARARACAQVNARTDEVISVKITSSSPNYTVENWQKYIVFNAEHQIAHHKCEENTYTFVSILVLDQIRKLYIHCIK